MVAVQTPVTRPKYYPHQHQSPMMGIAQMMLRIEMMMLSRFSGGQQFGGGGGYAGPGGGLAPPSPVMFNGSGIQPL